jgi:hypothetical protein
MIKKLALSLAVFGSSLAAANELITIEPGTFKKVGYVTVYCYDWGPQAPRSKRGRVNLNADSLRRCSFTALTYEKQKVTRIFPESSLQLNRPAKMRGDLFQLELERQEKLAEEFEREQSQEGWNFTIPIFSGQF